MSAKTPQRMQYGAKGERVSIYFPDSGTLLEAAKARAKALGYPSLSSYIVGLARLDALEEVEHDRVALADAASYLLERVGEARKLDHRKAQRIAGMTGDHRDAIDGEILGKFSGDEPGRII